MRSVPRGRMGGRLDRRELGRGRAIVPLRYHSGGRICYSYAENLSPGGLFIVADDPLPVGAYLELHFTPPRSNIPIHVLAEVRWSRRYHPDYEDQAPGMGVKFIRRLPKNGANAEPVAEPTRPTTPPVQAAPANAVRSAHASKPERPVFNPSPARQETEPAWAAAVKQRGVAEGGTPNAEIEAPPEPPAARRAEPARRVEPRDLPAVEKPTPKRSAPENADARPAFLAARRKSLVVLNIKLDLTTNNNFYVGLEGTIESGGVFVATYDALALETPVRLTFALPTREDPFDLQGVVAWLRPFDPKNEDVIPGMGIRLTNLHRRDAQAINDFIHNRREAFFVPEDS